MSISSKTLLSINVVRCGYVKEVPRWRYSHASTPTWRLYWNPEPGAWLSFHKDKIMLSPDVVVVIPPQTPFTTGFERKFSHFFVHFNFTAGMILAEPRKIFELSAGDIILPSIMENLPQMSVQQRFWAASSIAQAALLKLPEDIFCMAHKEDEHNFFNMAVAIIGSDAGFSGSTGELAKLCGTSVNTLQRQFYSATGLTVRKWMLNFKMEKAVQLLLSENCSIKETAFLLGFADRYHFSKVFKEYFGTTPAYFVKSGGIPLP